jgi:mono/diheme cytochrome c family protein
MMKGRNYLLLALPILVGLAGCHTDMWVQPKTASQQEGEFFADHSSARPLVEHTIARGFLREDRPFFTGAKDNKWLTELPMPVTEALLRRGQERFTIYCTPCHGRLGNGEGMIYKRGFAPNVKVATYHTDRLRNMPIGHFYDVITNGYGRMFSYAARVEPQDRWAIAAYIRVLQLSQHATKEDFDAAEAKKTAALSTHRVVASR